MHEAPEVPSVDFVAVDGARVSLSSFAGRTVILNLWATWCAPCIKEMPALDQLASTLPKDTHAVLAISQDKGGMAVARPFMDRLGLKELSAYADPQGALTRAFGVQGLPTTLVISPDSRLLARLEGVADWDHPEAARYLLIIGASDTAPTSH